MRRFVFLTGLVAGTILIAPAALAHQSSYEVYVGPKTGQELPDADVYVWNDPHMPAPSVWLDSNSKRFGGGVYPRADSRQRGDEPLGLQLNQVCYGTFTAAEVEAFNEAILDELYGAEYDVFSYLPFHVAQYPGADLDGDGTLDAAECEAICPPGGECGFVPADTLLGGWPPDYSDAALQSP